MTSKTNTNPITALGRKIDNLTKTTQQASKERADLYKMAQQASKERAEIAKDGSQGRAQIYFKLDKKIDDGLEKASEERTKFRNEIFTYLDKIYKEITSTKQEQKVIHHRVYDNHEPRISILESATL